MQKTQKIYLKLDFLLNEKGGYGYDGKIGPHVDKISTTFGGLRHVVDVMGDTVGYWPPGMGP
jgi:hypothetical protein